MQVITLQVITSKEYDCKSHLMHIQNFQYEIQNCLSKIKRIIQSLIKRTLTYSLIIGMKIKLSKIFNVIFSSWKNSKVQQDRVQGVFLGKPLFRGL